VRVPADVIDDPKSITVERIGRETNAEIRRVMIDRYGPARYLVDAGAQEISRDARGILYRKDVISDEPIVMVKVANSTAEPDGSFKDYFLRVDPQLRPLPPGSWPDERKRAWMAQQKPQELTPQNAVASTFGKRGDEYAPALAT
jgi:hypothetical protein